MYRVNDSNWPIVIFEFDGQQNLAAHEKFLEDWNKQFARNESFVAMRLFHDDNSLVSAEGTAQMTKAWLQNGAAQSIKTSVLAMINTVTPLRSIHSNAVSGLGAGHITIRAPALIAPRMPGQASGKLWAAGKATM